MRFGCFAFFSLTKPLPCSHKSHLCELERGALSLGHLGGCRTWSMDPGLEFSPHWPSQLGTSYTMLCGSSEPTASWQVCLSVGSLGPLPIAYTCLLCFRVLAINEGGPYPPPPQARFSKAMFVKSIRVQIPLFIMVAFKLNCAWNCLAKKAAFSI